MNYIGVSLACVDRGVPSTRSILQTVCAHVGIMVENSFCKRPFLSPPQPVCISLPRLGALFCFEKGSTIIRAFFVVQGQYYNTALLVVQVQNYHTP